MASERTLSILKPDATRRNLTGAINAKIEGAGLRISGSSRPNQLSGDSGWKKITFEFDVPGPSTEVVLVCELRAEKGRAWFDLGSLQLVRQN